MTYHQIMVGCYHNLIHMFHLSHRNFSKNSSYSYCHFFLVDLDYPKLKLKTQSFICISYILKLFFFFKIIYLFVRDKQREAETQAEGEAGSLWEPNWDLIPELWDHTLS